MNFLRFLAGRLLAALLTLLILTALLYGLVMLTPPETRATLYLPNSSREMSEAQLKRQLELIIRQQRLDDPYPLQYARWAGALLQGRWGYSPALKDNVLGVMLRRSPVTAELTLYSLLLFIPLGLASGMLAGARRERAADHSFRLAAFVASAIPPFILALVLLSVFYVALGWFPIERLSTATSQFVQSDEFRSYTGLVTVDGLLNGRLEVTFDALRHLVMPVFTLSLVHWATLLRVTRALAIEELDKDYVVAARARGLSDRAVVWGQAFPNLTAPALASSALSAASLFGGVFVVEVIFNFKGISEVAVNSINQTPDAPAVLGFAIYSVLVVLAITLLLDIAQAVVDPRLREGFRAR